MRPRPMPDASGLRPTPEQEAIIASAGGAANLMVTALAGCAKTSTLAMAAPQIRVPALALAFNKRIAQELVPRMPQNFSVKTLNGLGHQAWQRQCASRLQVDDRKLGKLVSQVAKDRKVPLASDQWDACRRLVTEAMLAGITPQDQGTPLASDTKDIEWWAIADEKLWMNEGEFDLIFDLAHEVLERSVALAQQGVISFDDQIYASVCLGGVFPKFPRVFIDEAQDLNSLNHAMLAKCLRPDGTLVAVGDPKQSIYQFRGSHERSMEMIRQLRSASDWLDLPLATTFRCPKVIVARQQSHAPGFTAWHLNPDGRYAAIGRHPVGLAEGWTWKDVTEQLPNDRASIAVLCRNNAPLLALAFKLLRQGIGVMMLGRDIGKNLQALAKQLAPDDAMSAAQCAGAIADWRDRECELARANQRPERCESIVDRAECLLAILASASCASAGDLRAMIGKLFARDAGQVTLGSIHRAKGLEYDCVLHLDPWRIPSKQAKRQATQGDPSQLQQEWNLKYVCETRTRHTLLEADLEGFR